MGLREIIQANGTTCLAIGGFLIGSAFGAIVYRTNFCTMGALSDIVNLSDWRRMRAWLLAAACALAGAQVMDAMGIVALSKSMYLTPNLNWLGNIVGGAMFGFGMVFAGGCASRNLARAGGGDLRALLTLTIVGLFAFMTIGGLLGPLRALLEQSTGIALNSPTQSLGDVLAPLTGLSSQAITRWLTALIVLTVLGFCFKDIEFRQSPVHIGSGISVGLCSVVGWALTGLAFDEMADKPVSPISLTFVRPVGDTIEWLERFTADRIPGFGVATVFGGILGAFTTAKSMGRFRLATFSDTGDTLRNLMGAALMGIGGVLAMGCTVGQAITGVSTLAIGSLLTFVSIAAGGVFGLKTLERWLMAEA